MARKLTDRQNGFVNAVIQGSTPTAAARSVGYSAPAVAAHGLMRHSKVLQTLRERRQSAISGDMATVALRTMSELMTDDTVPAATRYKASEWTLRAAGLGADKEREEDGPKALEDMNPAELAKAVESGMSALTELAQGLEGRHYVDGEFREVQRLPAAEEVETVETVEAEPADTAPDWME